MNGTVPKSSTKVVLETKNICKSFSGVEVLKNVNLTITKGEIHAIVGENGAGKSTLMKIIAGEYKPTSGSLFVNGEEKHFSSPLDAIRSAITLIHQEFSLVPQLSVYENVFLGRLLTRKVGGLKFIDKKAMKNEVKESLRKIGAPNISVDSKVSDLSVASKQIVEIVKALSVKPYILIMDEPTAALSLKETKTLFSILKTLKKQGVTIIFISHRLEEIFEIADKVSVLRNGELISTLDIEDSNMNDLVKMMVGRSLENRFPDKPSYNAGKILLRVQNFSSEPFFRNVNFELREGEVLGIAGLVGCGSAQVGEALFGLRESRGSVEFKGQEIQIKNPSKAMKEGILLVPEDRHSLGLVLKLTVRENHSLPNLDFLSKLGFIKPRKERKSALSMIDYLNTKVTSINQRVENLSGGNQQKVVLGKWIVRSPKVLILEEPTRGIDVGAKFEIYKFIYDQVLKGVAVILISSELEEVINISDRILVMSEGRITGELNSKDATPERVLELAVKGKEM
ncbi:sugar ABC transporter ATP-binding protein [Mesoaciditoga lauensis]|uniref:sugar ABC transporter ATP-binding protein n=1 Tax=Mesoaciditoga lauensis TaxID=1495039 RepID=UPI00068E334B|nr:sugar ABC transporter ATP-binding protein [Mesoaciditoga lauensis]